MEEQREIQSRFRQQQEKFVYNLIALSVASIGFSVYKTSNTPMSYSQIPLAIGVISWGLSIYCGLTFLRYGLNILYTNNVYFDILQGNDPITGTHPKKIEIGAKTLMDVMNKNIAKGSKYFHWQLKLFYLAILSFIVWHVYEMYLIGIDCYLGFLGCEVFAPRM